MRLGIFPPHIMHVVGRHQWDRKLPRELQHVVIDRALLIEALVLQLQIEIARTEDFQQRLSLCLGARIIACQQPMLYITCQTT